MKKLLFLFLILASFGISAQTTAEEYYNRGTVKVPLKDYNAAIADFTKAIELDPNYTDAYYNRAISKYYANDLIGACKDAKKVENLGRNFIKMIQAACN